MMRSTNLLYLLTYLLLTTKLRCG